jgi:hypothetical protein
MENEKKECDYYFWEFLGISTTTSEFQEFLKKRNFRKF